MCFVDALAGDLSTALTSGLSGLGEDYDFATDFK